MKAKQLLQVAAIAVLWSNTCISQDTLLWSSNRPDGHAPISVMGDHCHPKGGLMFSYRYMAMNMDGMLNGTTSVRDQTIYSKYMVSPQDMMMSMHMIGVMYAPSNRITCMVMGTYLDKSMNLRTKMGMDFSTRSAGFGDMNILAMIKLLNKKRQSLHTNIGASIPLGSIDQRDNTPMAANTLLGYPMQNGSGTIDPRFELVYLGQSSRFSWGVKNELLLRLYRNSGDYQNGNSNNLIAWGAIKATKFMSFSLGSSFYSISQTVGDNPEYNAMMMPLNSSMNSGNFLVSANTGMNIYVPAGPLNGLRFGLEFKLPVCQHVKGYQMNQNFSAVAGVQYALRHNH